MKIEVTETSKHSPSYKPYW